MKLEELLKSVSPLPWKFGYGIRWPKMEDAQYTIHAVNVLPEVVSRMKTTLRDAESSDISPGRMAVIRSELEAAIKLAQEVKDA